MQQITPETITAKPLLPRWLRIFLRILVGAIVMLTLAYVGLAWYINTYKKQVLESITATLNENLNGTLTVDDIEPAFLQGFPQISVQLQNVALTDSLYTTHNHALLRAENVSLAINALAFVRGAVQVKHITINNADAYLYTSPTGYSNTSVFKKSKSKNAGNGNGTFPELNKLLLKDVNLVIDNQKRGKLYSFKVNELKGSMHQKSEGWQADVRLDVLANSLAFSTQKGSFVKGRRIQGKMDIAYNKDAGTVTFEKNPLDIGGEDFRIGAKIWVNKPDADFMIDIENKNILWKNASHLLSPNISAKLDMFNIKKPIYVRCQLQGGFNIEGDPLILVNAKIKDNMLETPGGTVDDCSFTGVFTNEHIQGKGYNDANSAIRLYNFKGNYADIPVRMKKAFILNLEKPIAVGDFTSEFKMEKLNNLVDPGLIKFSGGTGSVAVNYRADIVNFKLTKPLVNGKINIKNAGVAYVPRGLNFKDITVGLDFAEDNLDISQINIKSGNSIINMAGNVKNFLNLYYTAPEKMVLNWNVYSPQLHLGEFMGFLNARGTAKKVTAKKRKGDFTDELNLLFDKSNVDIKLRVDKLYYNKFLATAAKADILLQGNTIVVKNAGLRHANGILAINGQLAQDGIINNYKLNAVVSNVDVRKFFAAFDNFGLESLNANNLRGQLSSKANVSGSITNRGGLVPKSIYGNVAFSLNKGALINFEPVKNVGKFAFPFRNMDTISFSKLNGRFDIKGEKVSIYPMQINTSILNMDVAGIYSFGKGTKINVDVPLRNPKRDKNITDKEELAKRRNRGIVLHLLAADDPETGKVKIKLGKGS